MDGPAKSESLVDRWNHQLIDGKHPMIYRVSTCFNHPFGGAGFRWPIHRMALDMTDSLYLDVTHNVGPPPPVMFVGLDSPQ